MPARKQDFAYASEAMLSVRLMESKRATEQEYSKRFKTIFTHQRINNPPQAFALRQHFYPNDFQQSDL